MKLDLSDKIPIYFQIADLIRQAILTSDLKEGEAISSVRKMAVEYGINHQTILKATQILINEGLIEKKRGQGMFVTTGAVQNLKKRELEIFLKKEIPAFVNRAKALNMSQSKIIIKINTEFEE